MTHLFAKVKINLEVKQYLWIQIANCHYFSINYFNAYRDKIIFSLNYVFLTRPLKVCWFVFVGVCLFVRLFLIWKNLDSEKQPNERNTNWRSHGFKKKKGNKFTTLICNKGILPLLYNHGFFLCCKYYSCLFQFWLLHHLSFFSSLGEELEYEYDDRGHNSWLCRIKYVYLHTPFVHRSWHNWIHE